MASRLSSGYKPCSEHQGKPMEYYCVECDAEGCQAGCLTEHKPHKTIVLSSRVKEMNKDLDFDLCMSEQTFVRVSIVELCCQSALKEKQTNSDNIKEDLLKQKQEMIRVVENYYDAGIQDVENELTQFQTQANQVIDRVKAVKAEITKKQSDVKEQINQGIAHDIFSNYKDMKNSLDHTSLVSNLSFLLYDVYTLERPLQKFENSFEELFGKLTKSPVPKKPSLLKIINGNSSADKKNSHFIDVAILPCGKIAVADTRFGNKKVKCFSIEGELLHQSQDGTFEDPDRVTSNSRDHNSILVIDYEKQKLMKWDMNKDEAEEFVISGRDNLGIPMSVSVSTGDDEDTVLIGYDSNTVLRVKGDGQVQKQYKMLWWLNGNLWWITKSVEIFT